MQIGRFVSVYEKDIRETRFGQRTGKRDDSKLLRDSPAHKEREENLAVRFAYPEKF